MSPTVSVIIPAYNAERTIEETLRSCLNQTVPPLEVLVVDDGSADRTAEIVERFPAPVRLLRKANGGPASARNYGARQARGEWLAMLDSDDYWLPTKLERQLRLDTSPDIGIIHSVVETARQGAPAEVGFEDLWDHNWVANSSVLIRKHVFEALGGFDEDRRLISVEDYNLWLRVAAAGWRIVTCEGILLRYTRGTGLSSHAEKFMAACVNNIVLVSETLKLPPGKTRAKLAQEYSFFGDVALHERNMRMARRAYWQATRLRPSLRNLVYLAISQAPAGLLNMRRQLAQSWQQLRAKASP